MISKKEQRKQTIKEAARQLFIEKNIEQTTFAEIASKASVGEATVYRHFENKGVLAMEIGMDYVSNFSAHLVEVLMTHTGSHLEKFEEVLSYYMELFIEKPDYFIYLEHFDNFIINSDQRPIGFTAYEHEFDKVNQVICDIAKGETVDDSVKKDVDVDLCTYTFNITFISLCQKLLLRGRVIEEDLRHNQLKELELMKTIMIDSLKA